MKKITLSVLVLFIIGSKIALYADATPAVANWPLILSAASTQAASTSGQIDAVAETLGGTLVFGSGPTASIGTPAMTFQRLKESAGTGWPAETAYNNNRFVQFTASPKTGGVLTVDTISVTIGSSGGTSALKADLFYSTNSNFSNPVPLGTTITLGNSTYTRVKFSALNILLNPGQSIYVRIFPWNSSAAAITGKYLALLNMAIGGSSVPIPVSSNIIWPCVSGLTTSVVTGTMMAGTTTLSNLLNYGSQTYNGQSAQSIYTGSVWSAESAPAEGRYVQFVAAPKSGGTLVVDSVRMKLAAGSTNDFRVSVFYSKDPGFTLATGTKLGSDVSVVIGNFSKWISALNSNNTFNSGEAMYLRLYPYHLSTSGDQWKFIGLDSIAVFGKVTGITADPPTVTSTAVSSISTTFATTGGNITTDGGAQVTDRGIVYSTTVTTPTIVDTKMQTGTGSGVYTTQLTGLVAGTTYYARAYATNSAGTSYGTVMTFTTMTALTVPVLTTTFVSSVLAITANSGGNVTDWGGSTVSSRGICWSTSPSPTILNSITSNGNGIGSFASSFCTLTPSTTYYVRAFATNETGTGYGNELSFTTQALAPDVEKTVNKDGTGNYTTIQAAFNDVPDNYAGRWIIHVKPGTYYEKCTLASTKSNVFLIGEDPATTIITYNAYAGQSNGAGGTWGTNNCFSVAIDASDFLAQNITFQNTQKNDGSTGSGGEQAVALRTKGDRQQYYNCRLLGYQDTYYTNSNGRIYMKKCYIEGSVDFIFGNGVLVLDSCSTFVNRDGGVVCAPNTDAASSFGYVFLNCTLSSLPSGTVGFNNVAMSSFYLGRPWQNNPKAAFIKCIEPATLHPGGWTTMTTALSPKFYEYKCTGAGSGITSRSTNVDYPGLQLTDAQALNYTIANIFSHNTNAAFACDWMPVAYVAPVPNEVRSISDAPTFLKQNTPNPMETTTVIQYVVPTSGQVQIQVLNLLGATVATLENEYKGPGNYEVRLNRENLGSGVYFYTLKTGNVLQTRKFTVK